MIAENTCGSRDVGVRCRVGAAAMVIVAALVIAAAPERSAGQCVMEDLGTMGEFPNSEARAVSADGSVVVGAVGNIISERSRAFRWTAKGGMQDLGTLGRNWARAYGVSADGSVVVGAEHTGGGTLRAIRWTVSAGWQDLGTLGGNQSQANGVSADGSVVVGRAQNADGSWRAFRWTAGGGMQDIGSMPGGGTPRAWAVSADGSVVVGDQHGGAQGHRRAFRWTASDGMQDLGSLGGGKSGAWDVSADGSVVVGESQNPDGAWRAFRWTAGGGMQDLGTLWGSSRAHGVSADGSVVVGRVFVGPSSQHAFRWTADSGMQDLGTLGGSWSRAYGVSADGSVVVGWARNADGENRAFRSLVDTDGDGIPDDWEINGVPYVDSNGNPQRYILPGADPMRKDLYVEIDVMAGAGGGTVPFSQSALNEVIDAFANAPVDNPDGSTGITLHLIVDETNIPHASSIDLDQIPDYREQWFGAESERNHPDAEAILKAKAKAFRYCIFVNQLSHSGSAGTILGYAMDIHADTFAVSLGGLNWPAAIIERYLGWTFMHELGHALGLYHGGREDNDILYKPNYISAMNPNFDELRRQSGGGWVRLPLDYSREVLLTLDESDLDETVGVPAAFSQGVAVPHAFENPSGDRDVAWVILGTGAHDWNRDGVFDTSVAVDLNWFPPGHPLASGETPGEGNSSAIFNGATRTAPDLR